jgi:hypothetical protein
MQNSPYAMSSKGWFRQTVKDGLEFGNRADTNFVPIEEITGQSFERCLSGLEVRVLQTGREDHRLKHRKLLVLWQTPELFFQLLEQSSNDLLPIGG